MLDQNPGLQEEFQLELKNRFEPLKAILPDNDVQDTYNKFQGSMEAAAETVVGSTKPKKSPNWVTNTTDQLHEKRNQAKLILHDKPTQVNRQMQKCKDLNEQLNKAYEDLERKETSGEQAWRTQACSREEPIQHCLESGQWTLW